MINALAAAKAYAATQKSAGIDPAMGGGATAGVGGGFGDMLKAVMTDAVSASKHAETQMAAQVAGKTELVDVVTAISAAEASLETVMAVRDQVISAYQEIMRMPI
ncbi:flagellar hook-basal body complex protein FliE [Phenylobacterium sp. J367]|uniref:flagellar hook-basal body complex protein FliE n=1 Tax=Phenylobacterium sp. J367 TaxID=2898435 RepID=UPI002150CF8C|nr:flagellar hook-basal body complex protein FliE [Phenylobacterium sp. J367]MCR5879081.1 flagellar hook-basal body complex protein FliE [Phenylobacterium sp. J367]